MVSTTINNLFVCKFEKVLQKWQQNK